MENIRKISLKILLLAEEKNGKSDKILKDALDKHSSLEKRERLYIDRLVSGTIERKLELDHIIKCFSSVGPKKIKPVILMLLRQSVYEILYMDGVPERASVNEAVKLCALMGYEGLKGYVNGVLRAVCRNKDAIKWPDPGKEPLDHLSVKYSVPLHIVKRLTDQQGLETTERILKAQLDSRPVFIRTNESRVSKDELKELLMKEGIETEDAPYVSSALLVKQPELLIESRAFMEGLFGISDIGAMLAVILAGIEEGDRVLDVCAAPGGKTCHVLDILRGSGEVVARDISEDKVRLINENIKRQGFGGNITTEVYDALTFSEKDENGFDVVIADLPCSGLGVMGRKKDIKYRLKEEDFEALALLQRRILKTVSAYVKPGGTLLYSTCTIDRAENQDNYDYIKNELSLSPESVKELLPGELSEESTEEGSIALLPGIHLSDGFFIARFRKTGDIKCM